MTRRWPNAAEEALKEYFIPTFNEGDVPLTATQMAEGFATHDALAPTVSDQITADIIAAGAAGSGRLIANFGVGVNHIDLSQKKKATQNLEATQEMEMLMEHLFIQDFDQLGFY